MLKGGWLINVIEVIRSHENSFSKQHKKLANYILGNFIDVSFMNITELAANAEVSNSTITRFAKTLGYNSFVEFQNSIKEAAKSEIIPVKEFKIYVKEPPVKDVLYDQVQESIAALGSMYNEYLSTELEAAGEKLCSAKNIYILASRSTFSMAYYCYFSLKRFQENVRLIENRNDDLSVNLQYVTKDDVLLVISYPLYTNFSLRIANYFKSQGCNIICITDSFTSPLAEFATNLLVVKNRLKTYFVTTIAVLNALIVLTGKSDPQNKIAMFEEENEVTQQLDVYFKK